MKNTLLKNISTLVRINATVMSGPGVRFYINEEEINVICWEDGPCVDEGQVRCEMDNEVPLTFTQSFHLSIEYGDLPPWQYCVNVILLTTTPPSSTTTTASSSISTLASLINVSNPDRHVKSTSEAQSKEEANKLVLAMSYGIPALVCVALIIGISYLMVSRRRARTTEPQPSVKYTEPVATGNLQIEFHSGTSVIPYSQITTLNHVTSQGDTGAARDTTTSITKVETLEKRYL